jgi:hypothetical protein
MFTSGAPGRGRISTGTPPAVAYTCTSRSTRTRRAVGTAPDDATAVTSAGVTSVGDGMTALPRVRSAASSARSSSSDVTSAGAPSGRYDTTLTCSGSRCVTSACCTCRASSDSSAS